MSTDPSPVKHPFKLQKLAYNAPEVKQPYLRISMFFNKRKDVSSEYFEAHWHHVHGDLVTSSRAFKDLKFLRYTQFRQRPEHRKLLEKVNYPVMDWDACTEFWVRDFEDFVEFTKSREYIEATPDMENFVHIPDGVRVMVGHDNLIFGEAVAGYGPDGVVRSDLEKLHESQ